MMQNHEDKKIEVDILEMFEYLQRKCKQMEKEALQDPRYRMLNVIIRGYKLCLSELEEFVLAKEEQKQDDRKPRGGIAESDMPPPISSKRTKQAGTQVVQY